jgi:TolB protein
MQSVTSWVVRSAARPVLLGLWLLLAGTGAGHAQLRLDVTEGVRDAVPIAVVPFGGQAGGGANDIAEIVAGDLRLSGRFAPLDRKDMVARPTTGGEIRFQDWRLLKSDYIVVGRVVTERGVTAVAFELFNVQTGESLLAETVPVPSLNMRAAAHRVADLVFERLTGIPGVFSTRIAYVSVEGTPPSRRYRLLVADADGFNPRAVTESNEPLMSPSWSPNGQELAYVSFETRTSAIYVQRLSTGERRRVSARAGINGAPAFAPDGRRLAVTLSRNGNLDIYILDLGTQALTRVTSDEAIDTEAAWSPDGKSIYFTSDRAGNAQVYRVDLNGAKVAERVTFTNSYNARPRVSPSGTELAMVTLDRGDYRIAVMDLKSRTLRVLSDGQQDESPSFAPNGATIIYASQSRGSGDLALVSSDGRFQERLRSDSGDVRDPAWSPFPAR